MLFYHPETQHSEKEKLSTKELAKHTHYGGSEEMSVMAIARPAQMSAQEWVGAHPVAHLDDSLSACG